MDPMPPINKVFALISQEENQKRLSIQSFGNDANGAATFTMKSDNVRPTINSGLRTDCSRISRTENVRKNERPFCTHCKYHGHSVDKCHKVHGYPLGYKPRSKGISQGYTTANFVNQITASHQTGHQDGMEKFMQNLNSTQY